MKINDALEAADMLRRNVVQGVRDASDESGVWGASSPPTMNLRFVLDELLTMNGSCRASDT